MEETGTLPSGPRLADLIQLAATLTAGIVMEEVLQPGSVCPELLTHLITALLESTQVIDD